MQYTIHGPFDIAKCKGLVDRSKLADFWTVVRRKEASLPSACGGYLFAIRAAKGIRPWYVGKAVKQPFEKECLKAHQLIIYNEAIAKRKGRPLLFLIAKKTKKGKFSRPGRAQQNDINFLETVLIGVALDKNPDLMNIQKTKLLREMRVPCLINTPNRRPTRSESEFKKAIK